MRERALDLTGKRFGRFTVIERDTSHSKGSAAYWICKCDCGNIKSVRSDKLRKGEIQSCGCLRTEFQSNKAQNLIGQRFGRLTVVERDITKPSGKGAFWLCQCDCGNTTSVRAESLRRKNNTKSCGCLIKEAQKNKIIDRSGQRFGRLTVIERAESPANVKSDNSYWLCRCDCGNTTIVNITHLRLHNIVSCGCQKEDYYKEIKELGTRPELLRVKRPNKNNSKTGIRGVTLKTNGYYMAYISFQHKRYILKTSKDLQSCIKARKEAETRLHDNFLEWYDEYKAEEKVIGKK